MQKEKQEKNTEDYKTERSASKELNGNETVNFWELLSEIRLS